MHGTSSLSLPVSGSPLLSEVLIGVGTTLLVGVLMHAAFSGIRRNSRLTDTAPGAAPDRVPAVRRLNAVVFLGVLALGVLLTVLDTSTTRMAAAGSFVAVVANVWFRAGRDDGPGPSTRLTVRLRDFVIKLRRNSGDAKDEQ